MKRLLSYLRQYPVQAVMAPLFKCLEACFDLFVPLVVSRMIDTGIGYSDSGYIFRMGGLLLLLAAVGLACSVTAQWFAAAVAAKTGRALRTDLFHHVMGLGYAEIDGLGTSTLLTRMTSDINQVQTGINMFLRLFMRSPFIVFGSIIMAFTVDKRAALIFAAAIPLLTLIVFGIMLGTMPLYRKVQALLDRVMLLTRENLAGARVVRAFHREPEERAAFGSAHTELAEAQIFVGKISALLNPATVVVVNLAIAVLLWTSGIEVNLGELSQGQTVALVNYMSQILIELIKLANLIILVSKAFACMKRLDNVFAVHSPVEENRAACAGEVLSKEKETSGELVEKPSAPKVAFDGVDFSYAGAQGAALSGISFAAMPGETIGIIGGTGSGKSTLVNLIPHFYEAQSGSISVDGRDVRAWDAGALRAKIGLVPQRAVLFAGTLRDNMRFGRKDASDAEIYEALGIAQAREIVEAKAEGLDFVIEQGGRNLSGGQRQRLTIARALVKQPEILILDDSASALDFATDARLRQAIRERTKGLTVFLISQRASTVRRADRIIVLNEGRIEGVGTHKELLGSCPLYREICLTQMTKEEVERDEQ